MVKTKEYV